MGTGNSTKRWERTNVTNLVRHGQSGTYYARVKVNGKEKWRTLKTKVFSVAKLRLGDVEKETRAQGGESSSSLGPQDMTMGTFIDVYLERTRLDASLATGTRERRVSSVKALVKTWPDLRNRDVRRITASDCREWSAKALREGTGFIAPRAKTVRGGMSSSAFNKVIDVLRGVFAIACESGAIYANPAQSLAKAPLKKKRLELPTSAQFEAILKCIRAAGSRWSVDCADMVQFLVYSGARLREATSIQWRHVDFAKGVITIPGSKTETSYRVVPMIPRLAELLEQMRQGREVEEPTQRILRVGECLGALARGCQEVGLKPLTHHDLRHLFATRCIESGVDVPTVSRWLGHSDGGALAMKTYGHLRQEHSLAAAAKVRF